MKKKVRVDDDLLAVSCEEKIKARLARDERRMMNKREVYTYRINGICSDNLLMFDSSTKDVHGEVFKFWYSGFSADEKARFKGVEVIHVGTYDKLTMKLNTAKEHKIIFKGI